jgi:hypothetical protein
MIVMSISLLPESSLEVFVDYDVDDATDQSAQCAN